MSGDGRVAGGALEDASRSPRIAAIVLAAGRSARMGAATNKLLEVVAGRPLVAWPVDAMREAGLAPIVVVTGFEAARVRESLADRGCVFVEHERWGEGMGSSLAAAVSRLDSISPELDAVVVSVGDLPGLRARHVDSVIAATPAESGGALRSVRERIVVPTCRGRAGHPVLFGRFCWGELARLSGDRGGRSVVAAHGERVVRIDLDDEAILVDIDTPDALERAKSGEREQIGSGDPSGRRGA